MISEFCERLLNVWEPLGSLNAPPISGHRNFIATNRIFSKPIQLCGSTAPELFELISLRLLHCQFGHIRPLNIISGCVYILD
jgi:hypothetical protein